MRFITKFFTGILLLVLATPLAASSATYNIDTSHSLVRFSVPHLVISSVEGRFKEFSGTIEFDEKSITSSKANVTINVASIDTDEAKRDKHLRDTDFFDVAKYPEMKFSSLKFKKKGNKLLAVGTLQIKDVTKEVELDVDYKGAIVDPWGMKRIAFSATTQINRKDFGVSFHKVMEAGGLVVGDQIDISIKVEAVAKP